MQDHTNRYQSFRAEYKRLNDALDKAELDKHYAEEAAKRGWRDGLIIGVLVGAGGSLLIEYALRVLFGG